jgi:hypothetical protein
VNVEGEMVEIPTTERLARDLEEAGAPEEMVQRARDGYYDDFKSPLAMPEVQLMADAQAANLPSIVDGVRDGRWDSTREEADEWARSPDGQKTFRELLTGFKPRPV